MLQNGELRSNNTQRYFYLSGRFEITDISAHIYDKKIYFIHATHATGLDKFSGYDCHLKFSLVLSDFSDCVGRVLVVCEYLASKWQLGWAIQQILCRSFHDCLRSVVRNAMWNALYVNIRLCRNSFQNNDSESQQSYWTSCECWRYWVGVLLLDWAQEWYMTHENVLYFAVQSIHPESSFSLAFVVYFLEVGCKWITAFKIASSFCLIFRCASLCVSTRVRLRTSCII